MNNTQDPFLVLQLTDAEKQTLKIIIDNIAIDNPYDQLAAFEAAALAAEAHGDELPRLKETLQEFSTHASTFKALMVKASIPDDYTVPPTPDHYTTPDENEFTRLDMYRAFILGLMGVYPYGYTSQQPGNIVNNVIPLQKQTEEMTHGASANMATELGFHIEDASFNLSRGILDGNVTLPDGMDLSPDWLSNHFLRNPGLVPTTISAPDLTKLQSEQFEILQQPYYHNATNPGQQENGDNELNVRLGIIYNEGKFLRANLADLSAVEDAPQEAKDALDALKELINDSRSDLDSEPGDINIIDNRRVLHGRAIPTTPEQQPKYQGADRWQRRVVAYDQSTLTGLKQNFGENFSEIVSEKHIVNPSAFLEYTSEFGHSA